ncbi:Fatty acid synthase [Camponotus floridanus]|uniref:Fatty acid synthase n=1 Tax=Camponotus floridanus TaxID=104421 RepID=E2AZI5_CAMFO|nr:Fatty acid synthase [Camponotus floridanus]
MSIEEAHTIDPGTRILFESTYAAIIDAVVNPAELQGQGQQLSQQYELVIHISIYEKLHEFYLAMTTVNLMMKKKKGADYMRSDAATVVYLPKAKDARRIYPTFIYGKTNCEGFKEEGITFPSFDKHLIPFLSSRTSYVFESILVAIKIKEWGWQLEKLAEMQPGCRPEL